MAAVLSAAPLIPAACLGAPDPPPDGYDLVRVSDGLSPASLAGIGQLSFQPGEPSHLYATRTYFGTVTRFDHAPSGLLTNAVDVATGLPYPVGVAFHGTELFVTLNLANDGRIARLRDLDGNGTFEERVDFVRGIPRGDHHVNQLQIRANALWTSIGQRGNNGDPRFENVYTGTLVRVADLGQVDFAGGANYLPDSTTFVDPAPIDGWLRRYARGFRNTFGVRLDVEGRLWATDNGASACATCSARNRFPIDTPDLVYRDVQPGDKGIFPPEGYPGGGGATIQPCAILGLHVAATGFAFVTSGPDDGRLLVAEYGPTDTTLAGGRDVVRVDPDSGSWIPFLPGFDRPTDLVAGPFGEYLIADYDEPAIYRLSLTVSDASTETSASPVGLSLGVSPNPCSGQSSVTFALDEPSPITLFAFDAAGRVVARIAERHCPQGRCAIAWNGRDDRGQRLPAGEYWLRLDASGATAVRRISLLP